MPVILKLDTKPTLFEPLEIEVDEARLRVKEITLKSLERLQNLEVDLRAGSAKAIREALQDLIEGDITPLLNLPVGKVQTLVAVLVEKSIKASTEEKNGPRPADAS
jgi:hypothetical protein